MPDAAEPESIITTGGIIGSIVASLLAAIGWIAKSVLGDYKERIAKLEAAREQCEEKHDVIAEKFHRLEGRMQQVEQKL
jgi:hypothetical protein